MAGFAPRWSKNRRYSRTSVGVRRCGVNLSLDTTTAVGQTVIASTQPSTWHRVTEDNLMDETSLVGVAAYFRT